MTVLMRKWWVGVLLITSILAQPVWVNAQDYFATDVKDIKSSPQRYWAKGIVFRDTLVEQPQRRTLSIDNRTVTRFVTEQLGEVYAEKEAVELLNNLAPGVEYLFSGTVGQRGRRYYTVVRSVSAYRQDTENIPALLGDVNLLNTTNQFNRVFIVLDGVMKDVHKDLFGFATANNIKLEEMFGRTEHRDKVAASIRSALRRFEENSKTTSQEFFVSIIISMLALQYGYVEQVPASYEAEPPASSELDSLPDSDVDDEVGPESWDIPDEQIQTEPAPMEEPAPPASGMIESQPVEIIEDAAVVEPVEVVEESMAVEMGVDLLETEETEPIVDEAWLEVPPVVEETISEPVAVEEIDVSTEVFSDSTEIEEELLDTAVPEADAAMAEETEVEMETSSAAPAEEEALPEIVSPELEVVAEPEVEIVPDPAPAVVETVIVVEPELDTNETRAVESEKTKPAPGKDEIDYSRPVRLR